MITVTFAPNVCPKAV